MVQIQFHDCSIGAFRDYVERRLVFLCHVQLLRKTPREESYKFHKESARRIHVLFGRLHRRQ